MSHGRYKSRHAIKRIDWLMFNATTEQYKFVNNKLQYLLKWWCRDCPSTFECYISCLFLNVQWNIPLSRYEGIIFGPVCVWHLDSNMIQSQPHNSLFGWIASNTTRIKYIGLMILHPPPHSFTRDSYSNLKKLRRWRAVPE